MRIEVTPPPIAPDKDNMAPPDLQVSGSLHKANVVRSGEKVRQRSRIQTEHSNLLIRSALSQRDIGQGLMRLRV